MSIVHFTRLVIETTSPMAITSGQRETGFDSQLARDANGLPYIPATAIAGVWRHLAQTQLGEDTAEIWFGSCQQVSLLTIGHGVVHSSRNQPVVGPQPKPKLQQDPLLKLLLQSRPHHRERVRINDRGVAAETGKFDQLLLPAGIRFCLDVRWQAAPENNNQDQWQQLLQLWLDRRFAFGSSTRNGLGRFKVVGCNQHQFDLRTGPNAGKQLQQARSWHNVPQTSDLNASNAQLQPLAVLPLQALDNWRCGGGTELLSSNPSDHSVNIISYSEPRVRWLQNHAQLGDAPKPVLCGSSIKGILAHRIAFHYRRRSGETAEQMAEADHLQWQQRPTALHALLGHADDTDALAGRLWVDDCAVEHQHTVIRTHNSIDRFTGGVRQGALYSEELLYQPRFTLTLWLAPGGPLAADVAAALQDTINDLRLGLLPMGAGGGRGTSLVMQDPQHSQHWQDHSAQLTQQEPTL